MRGGAVVGTARWWPAGVASARRSDLVVHLCDCVCRHPGLIAHGINTCWLARRQREGQYLTTVAKGKARRIAGDGCKLQTLAQRIGQHDRGKRRRIRHRHLQGIGDDVANSHLGLVRGIGRFGHGNRRPLDDHRRACAVVLLGAVGRRRRFAAVVGIHAATHARKIDQRLTAGCCGLNRHGKFDHRLAAGLPGSCQVVVAQTGNALACVGAAPAITGQRTRPIGNDTHWQLIEYLERLRDLRWPWTCGHDSPVGDSQQVLCICLPDGPSIAPRIAALADRQLRRHDGDRVILYLTILGNTNRCLHLVLVCRVAQAHIGICARGG